ncbi:hypothetical protein CO038_02055 [Candidatus Pacearchaeota archaeon CG_4_9_14_0_2_um_filter_39_13]|nr:hypothetical protein [Candidatus Pacearchaeota archaeon]OIO43881.1 MAG: hypothetical protein AUJ64_01115 [Candidatus Pacearchaeota archaeon CG1_02_39_14]PJC44730.1 MAG: hypothetical protein CO038_02055 [Candidatus Pacearchaeota archaeon CG_4_9_14_0_2_um_filter_39_13]
MKFEVNINKRVGVGIIASILIFAGVLLVLAYDGPIPNPGHGGDRVWVDINGTEMTLQDAIGNGEIFGSWLCNHVDGKQPCVDAADGGGLGRNGYRFVNCIKDSQNEPIVSRAMRYNPTRRTWQFYMDAVDQWADCQEGSALIVRAFGP